MNPVNSRYVVAALALAALAAGCPYHFPEPTTDGDGSVNCGNGAADPGEECDDGNTEDDDGCDSNCDVELGWTCTGSPSTCTPFCGDGIEAGNEGCDDGNHDNTDECPDDVAGGGTCQPAVCGDGFVWAGNEECEDGNLDNTDACPDDGANGGTCRAAFCGDGLVWDGHEECDDGNTQPGDGCSNGCVIDCSSGALDDCNWPGSTLNAAAAFVDRDPPEGFVQCAGFRNTDLDDVDQHWEGHCLGAARVLRVRYWDASAEPWVLLGDATLNPASTSGYEQQTFDASNHAGLEGFMDSQGATFLKDDPAVSTLQTHERCNFSGSENDYGANDFYAATRAGTKTLYVCSADNDYVPDVCPEDRELFLVEAQPLVCEETAANATALSVAIYYRVD